MPGDHWDVVAREHVEHMAAGESGGAGNEDRGRHGLR